MAGSGRIGWANLGGGLVSAPVPCRTADGRLTLTAAGAGGVLHIAWTTRQGGWTRWAPISDTAGAACRPEPVRGADGRMRVFYNTAVGTLHEVRETAVGGGWAPASATPAVEVQRAPHPVLDATGRVLVCYRNTAGQLHVLRPADRPAADLGGSRGGNRDEGRGSTRGKEEYDPPEGLDLADGPPGAALDGSGRVVLAFPQDGLVRVRRESVPGTGSFGPAHGIAEAPEAAEAAEVLAVADATGRVHVFHRGVGGELWSVSQDDTFDGWRVPVRLGCTSRVRPGACLGADGRLRVVVHGADHAAWLGLQESPGSAGFAGPFARLGGRISVRAPAVTLASRPDGRLLAAYLSGDDAGDVLVGEPSAPRSAQSSARP